MLAPNEPESTLDLSYIHKAVYACAYFALNVLPLRDSVFWTAAVRKAV